MTDSNTPPPPGEPPFDTDREVVEGQCDMEFVRSSGPGGQHKNRRETGVRLVHRPSGIVVMATERRSQAQNRDVAFDRLLARLEERNEVRAPRRETAPSRAERERRLARKRRAAARKALRRPPQEDA